MRLQYGVKSMENTKVWWQSRTIWSGIIGAVFAILSILNLLPADLTTIQVVDAIMAVTSVAAIVFRVKSTTVITIKK